MQFEARPTGREWANELVGYTLQESRVLDLATSFFWKRADQCPLVSVTRVAGEFFISSFHTGTFRKRPLTFRILGNIQRIAPVLDAKRVNAHLPVVKPEYAFGKNRSNPMSVPQNPGHRT